MNRLLIILFSVFEVMYCANILGVFMSPSISHQIVYQPIWRELSLRGHRVTVITPDPLNDPNLTNLTEISVRSTYELFQKKPIQEVMGKDQSPFDTLEKIYQFVDPIVEAQLNSPEVKKLIADDSKHFDLVLVECLHPVMYAFAGRFKSPSIGVSPFGLLTSAHDIIGNPNHPIVYPDTFLAYPNADLSLWQKINSVTFTIWARYHYKYIVLPRAQELAKKYFGDDIPDVAELEKNQSLYFVNVNPLVYPPRPRVPAIIELGMMHIKPVQPLPRELQKILDDATEGIIYFSLGSNVKSTNLEPKLRKTITDALSELPFKVLWKWESDSLPGKPDNVITKKWLPQQDLLAHKNIRAFVTQGGLQSIEEAISRTVPLVGMPFIADQPMNVQKIVEWEIGLGLDPVTVTKEELTNSIMEVATNTKYKERMKEVRDLIFDKPMSGLQKAIWWSEYVIRHKGAKHLRSPTADISWFDYLLLDVILTFIGVFSVIIYLSSKVAQFSYTYRRGKLKVH